MTIRTMTTEDIPVGLRLCRTARWNHTAADWRRLLAHQPNGCFVAEVEGATVATATTTAYGTACAWIGMVLVDPNHRRRGLGTALLEHCIAYLRSQRVVAIKLDATDSGRAVYAKLGFVDEYPVQRWIAHSPRVPRVTDRNRVIPLRDDDWPAIASLDLQAFGVDRSALLRQFAADEPRAALVAIHGDRRIGCAFARRGHDAVYLGPVVAEDPRTGHALIAELLDRMRPQCAYLDTLGPNAHANHLAAEFGFAVQRRLTRMVLGANAEPGRPALVYAATGFETG